MGWECYLAQPSANQPLRGVNLGGWLVLERWMTPSLFAGTDAEDEYSFMQTPDALAKLRQHQRTFIREEDFKWMAANGITAVRIPVGYWLFEGDDPFVSCIGRLDWAVRMADTYGLRVLICLHGAPGSQNGEHHSGRSGRAAWFDDAQYRDRTIDVLVRLAKRYAKQSTVWGLELLNEPHAWRRQLTLRSFHKQAYAAIRAVARPGLVTVFHDGFMPRTMTGSLKPYHNYPVMMDVHWYQFLTPIWLQKILPFWCHRVILRARARLFDRLARAQPVIVGEWSGVIGWQTLQRLPSEDHQVLMRQYSRRQVDLYGSLAGWFYWSYKTEERGVFHFRSMVEDGVFEKKS